MIKYPLAHFKFYFLASIGAYVVLYVKTTCTIVFIMSQVQYKSLFAVT